LSTESGGNIADSNFKVGNEHEKLFPSSSSSLEKAITTTTPVVAEDVKGSLYLPVDTVSKKLILTPQQLSDDFDFKIALGRLPELPGVYRMYSATGTILYIGKSKNLKNRVRSYFQSTNTMLPKVQALMQHVVRFDYIVTDSEVEALLLEFNLVQKHLPKYNILLKDDKKFPWIGLSGEAFPRLFVTRDPRGKGRFFGPFLNSKDMYRTLEVIRKHFPLRQRRKPLFKNRPCINYSIGACSGPCQNLVTQEEYAEVVRQVELFLKGKGEDLLGYLEAEMDRASVALQFERAAKLRDRHRVVQDVVIKQKMFYTNNSVSQDIIGMSADLRRCAFSVLNIRRGKLIGSRPHEIRLVHGSTPEEAYQAFLDQYYQPGSNPNTEAEEDMPAEIIVQQAPWDEEVFQELLQQRSGRKVTLTCPKKGIKKELLDLSIKNANEILEQVQDLESKNYRSDPIDALIALQDALQLPEFPTRMECYDISHFQGSETVASMVVFIHGVPDKREYRRFKIQCAEGEPDDFASMHEVISRRFNRAVTGKEGWAAPDLVIIDGGKGQLSSAVAALNELGMIQQPIISLAKKFEEVYRPNESRPILLPRDSAALFVLQQIRDEAHRFAITYHRQRRDMKSTTSALDGIVGIGETRRKRLLTFFGSVEKVAKASTAEIATLPGFNLKVAQQIMDTLNGKKAE
jgi:excinuclease ABC subunit C